MSMHLEKLRAKRIVRIMQGLLTGQTKIFVQYPVPLFKDQYWYKVILCNKTTYAKIDTNSLVTWTGSKKRINKENFSEVSLVDLASNFKQYYHNQVNIGWVVKNELVEHIIKNYAQ